MRRKKEQETTEIGRRMVWPRLDTGIRRAIRIEKPGDENFNVGRLGARKFSEVLPASANPKSPSVRRQHPLASGAHVDKPLTVKSARADEGMPPMLRAEHSLSKAHGTYGI
jgi:hypothetical protein